MSGSEVNDGPWLEAAFFVYPESGAAWRLKVECNGDVPGCLDIAYQEYEKVKSPGEGGQWSTRTELATLDVKQARLLRAALARMCTFLEEVDGVQP